MCICCCPTLTRHICSGGHEQQQEGYCFSDCTPSVKTGAEPALQMGSPHLSPCLASSCIVSPAGPMTGLMRPDRPDRSKKGRENSTMYCSRSRHTTCMCVYTTVNLSCFHTHVHITVCGGHHPGKGRGHKETAPLILLVSSTIVTSTIQRLDSGCNPGRASAVPITELHLQHGQTGKVCRVPWL